MEIRIGLLASGVILQEGQPVDLAQLDSRLSQAHSPQDRVLYYKEAQADGQLSIEIVKLVIKNKLAVSFSTKPDFSDYVDQSGHSHPRPAPAAMPEIDAQRDPAQAFAEARDVLTKLPRGIALVTPDRRVLIVPVPTRSAKMDALQPKVPGIPDHESCNIAVIANTGIVSEMRGQVDLQAVSKTIPFLGLLIGLGYTGHRVWIFEGHPSALVAGLEHAQILLIDSAMLPFLPKNGMSEAQRVMSPPRRVLIHDGESYKLLAAAPVSTA